MPRSRRPLSAESIFEFWDASGVDPAQVAFADFVGGQNATFDDPLFQRFEISFKNAFNCTDTPNFGLCTHGLVLWGWQVEVGLPVWVWVRAIGPDPLV